MPSEWLQGDYCGT